MTPGRKFSLPTATTFILCSPLSQSLGFLSTWQSQSDSSQTPGQDFVLALIWITWLWCPRTRSHSSLTLYAICDLDISIRFTFISFWWYKTPPWVLDLKQSIINELEAIKSISLKGNGIVMGRKVFVKSHLKTRKEIVFHLFTNVVANDLSLMARNRQLGCLYMNCHLWYFIVLLSIGIWPSALVPIQICSCL